jgi:hypothetical protein
MLLAAFALFKQLAAAPRLVDKTKVSVTVHLTPSKSQTRGGSGSRVDSGAAQIFFD